MKMLRCIRGVCDAPMQRCKASTLNPARSYRESGPETLIYISTRVKVVLPLSAILHICDVIFDHSRSNWNRPFISCGRPNKKRPNKAPNAPPARDSDPVPSLQNPNPDLSGQQG